MKKQKWELKMNEARDLRKQGVGLLFDRVTLLVACYEDKEFRSWCESNGTSDLDYLDNELSDVATGFLTMKAVLFEYPERDSWINHNIRELIAMVIEAEREKSKRENEPNRPSWKERALAAEKECERLRAENQGLRESLGIVAKQKCA